MANFSSCQKNKGYQKTRQKLSIPIVISEIKRQSNGKTIGRKKQRVEKT